MEKIYIVKRSNFSIYKTIIEHQPMVERGKDYKNNYPINIPIPALGRIRIDGLSNNAYYYGLIDVNTTIDPLIALLIVGHEGLIEIYEINKETVNTITCYK